MTLRKGEIALSADKVHGAKTATSCTAFADAMSAAPCAFSIRCDDSDFVVFCFAKRETMSSSAFWADRQL